MKDKVVIIAVQDFYTATVHGRLPRKSKKKFKKCWYNFYMGTVHIRPFRDFETLYPNIGASNPKHNWKSLRDLDISYNLEFTQQ